MKIFSEKTKYNIGSWTTVAIVAGILILINILAGYYFIRWDVTQNKQYTLSSASKDMLHSLDDYVTIKVFFSDNLPPQWLPVTAQVRDMLSEYQSYAGSNLVVKYIDTNKDEGRDEAKSLGIPEVEFNLYEQDKVQVQKGFLGLAVLYEDNTESIPVLEDTKNLEYELTSLIKKVMRASTPVIGFVNGHEEHTFSQDPNNPGDYVSVAQSLSKNYTVQEVSLDNQKELDAIDALVVAGSKKSFSQRDLYVLDQYLVNGGTALFFLDSIQMNQGLSASPFDNGLNQILSQYGITLEKNIVLDVLHENASFRNGMVQYIQPYPFFIHLKNENFSLENPISAHIDDIVIPWGSSLTLGEKDGVQTEALLKTTPRGWTQSSPFNLDPNQDYAVPKQDKDPVVLAAFSRGSIESSFKGKEVPSVASESDAQTDVLDPIEFHEMTDNESSIVVVGDSDFIGDQAMTDWQNNLKFFLNAVDYLAFDESLIQIRAKGVDVPELKEVSDSARLWTKIVGVFGMPLLFIVYGFVLLTWRKKKASL